MMELIAGIGLGIWVALAITVLTYLYAKKNDLLEDKRDRFLRGDIDSAFERIEEIEKELVRTQNLCTQTDLTLRKNLLDIYNAVNRATGEDTPPKKED